MNVDKLEFDTYEKREDARRELLQALPDSLREEMVEHLTLIKTRKIFNNDGNSEQDASPNAINNAINQTLALSREIDQVEAYLKSWHPPAPENKSLVEDKEPPLPDWLIEHWMPRNELTVFSGMGGTGKSHIMLNLAIASACGCPESFLDAQGTPNPDQAERTMFASWEDSLDVTMRRVQRIRQLFTGWFEINQVISDDIHKSVKSNLIYRDMKPQNQIWIPATESGHISNRGMMSNAGHELLASCIDEKVSLLILDSLIAVYGQDPNSAAHVRPFLNYLSAWANEKEITVVLIGHPNRTGQGGVSGSADWHNGVRSRWELEEKNKKEYDDYLKKSIDNKGNPSPEPPPPYYALIHAKANDAPQMPEIPLIRHQNGIYEKATGKNLDQQIMKAQKAYQEYQDHWKTWKPQSQEDMHNDESDAIADLIANS